ncbi:hypothetical protein ACV33P_31525, partial [Pseudomonas aeruginosa]
HRAAQVLQAQPRRRQRPAVRVRANPTARAAAGRSLEDLRSTLTSNNLNGPKGSFDGPTRASTLDANDQ